jgi:hypothetical protein
MGSMPRSDVTIDGFCIIWYSFFYLFGIFDDIDAVVNGFFTRVVLQCAEFIPRAAPFRDRSEPRVSGVAGALLHQLEVKEWAASC